MAESLFSKERRTGNRKNQFKKGIDGEDARRKREDSTVEIRKSKREEQLSKRRVGIDKNTDIQISESKPPRDPSIDEKLRALPTLVAGINSQDPNTVIECVTQFRKLLSIERDPPIQEVIDCGAVPKLVQFLSYNDYPSLQFESAWALTNIASGTSKHTQTVLEQGSVPAFISLLRSPNVDVREQAVWALGNIAGDSHTCRDLVLSHGALQPLTSLCSPDARLTMIRNATWTLSNFCRGKPQPDFVLVSPALNILNQLIMSKDDEVLTDACWALSYLSDDTGPNNQKIQAVIQAGVVRRLVELLGHKNTNVVTPALRTVGNIVTGDDLQTQAVLNCQALQYLLALLGNSKRAIKKEACWTISNITAGNAQQIGLVIDHNIIPVLVSLLRSAEFDIKKEAAWAISNATSGGSEEQIRFLVGQGCIPPLCELFVCPDPKIITVALEGIENILRIGQRDAPKHGGVNKFAEFVEECHGLDAIEQLQQHDNEKIFEKSQRILKLYFGGDEEAVMDQIAPVQQGGQFAFGAPAIQGAPSQQPFQF